MFGQMVVSVQKKLLHLVRKSLTEHLNIFVSMTDEAQTAEIMVEKEEDQKEKVFEMTIEELDLRLVLTTA